jgi:hypothetical protein
MVKRQELEVVRMKIGSRFRTHALTRRLFELSSSLIKLPLSPSVHFRFIDQITLISLKPLTESSKKYGFVSDISKPAVVINLRDSRKHVGEP